MPDTNYFPLVVGVISFFASVSAAVLAGYFVRRNEHAKWLRQERLVAYSGFLGHVASLQIQSEKWLDGYYDLPVELRPEIDASVADLLTRGYTVRLLASHSMAGVVVSVVRQFLQVLYLPDREARVAAHAGVIDNLDQILKLARLELGSG